tara:strand:- start:1435 stop:1716 length:282 start_codon:yes stop_codon:yes gene_type:complete
MIDFRFRVKKSVDRDTFINDLNEVINLGALKGLYALDDKDMGPEVHNCSDYSTVFIKEGIKSLNDNFYLQGYFDNENSVNRFYDLANFISSKS